MDGLYANRLKELRRKKNLTQAETAERLHISLTHYTKIEVGTNKPSPELHAAICLLFEVPSDYFFYEERQERLLTREQIDDLYQMTIADLETITFILLALKEKLP